MEKLETGFRDTSLADTDSPKRYVDNESLSTNHLVANTQESLLQSQTKSRGDVSDELVDVRVCDICGDTGREALLALCSMCSDGAEHIYCMRNKMDSVPEKDWMCEECIGMQELKGQIKVVAEKAGSAVNSSCLADLIQPSSRKSSIAQQVGEPSIKHSRKTLCLASKRHTKKRKFEEGIHPAKSCISSRKIIDKGKRAFEPAFSSDNKLPKFEERSCKGSLYKSKTDIISELNTKLPQLNDGILPRIDTAIERADSKLEKHSPNKKLFKSLSFAGSVSSDVPNPQFSYNKSKGLKCGNERKLTKNVSVPETKTNSLYLLSPRSCSMKVRSSRTKVISKTAKAVPFLDKDVQVGEDNKVDKSGFLAPKVKKHAKQLARLVGEKSSSGSVKLMPTLAPAKTAPSTSSIIPAAECIWRGGFNLEKSANLPNYCNRVQAHMSRCVSSKVNEVVSKFGPKLVLKEVARSETWPTYFRRNCPTEQDIALYFFAEDLQSYNESYKMLLDGMMGKDLVLEANFDGIQLLILPSSLLPATSRRWNSFLYLWGTCRVRRVNNHSPHLNALNVATLNQDLRTPESPNKCVSTVEAGSFSQTSHNSIQGQPEPVYPLVVQSSYPTKSNYQSCLIAGEEIDVQPDMMQSFHQLNEANYDCGASHTDEKLKGIQSDDQDIKCTTKTTIFPFGQSNGENLLSLSINSGISGLHSAKSFKDIPSRSSISIDSGPCKSSDGYARSYEVHGEHYDKPPSSKALSLDLCLGFNSQPEEQVGLDLVLGSPGKYQPKHCTGSRDTTGRNMSLFLSLGMPCSNA